MSLACLDDITAEDIVFPVFQFKITLFACELQKTRSIIDMLKTELSSLVLAYTVSCDMVRMMSILSIFAKNGVDSI